MGHSADYFINECLTSAKTIYEYLGPGWSEAIYQSSMEVELYSKGINFEAQRPMVVEYRGYSVGTAIADLILLNGKPEEGGLPILVVELKSSRKLGDSDGIQLKRYLECLGVENGILINFGKEEMEWTSQCISFNQENQ